MRRLLALPVLTALVLAGPALLAGCDSATECCAPNDPPDFTATLTADQTVPRIPASFERGTSGTARFWLRESGRALEYEIVLDGLDVGGIQGDPVTENGGDDVTQLHLHVAPAGERGPHALNVFGAPAEDDADMTFDPASGTIRGLWDDGDVSTDPSIPEAGRSVPFTDALADLCAGRVYVNVHPPRYEPGELRGQVAPTADVTVCLSL